MAEAYKGSIRDKLVQSIKNMKENEIRGACIRRYLKDMEAVSREDTRKKDFDGITPVFKCPHKKESEDDNSIIEEKECINCTWGKEQLNVSDEATYY
jgi:hypothetical protein